MENPTWKSQIDAEAKRKIQAEKAHAENGRFQTSPEALERNRQSELSRQRVKEALTGMNVFNYDVTPVLSSFNQEVWNNLGTISVSDHLSLPYFNDGWTGYIDRNYGFKSIILAHKHTLYSGEYEDVKRTKFGRYTRTGGGGGGGWNSPGSEPTWSKDETGSYKELGRRLIKINENTETDSISVRLGYSDLTELFELQVADSMVAIEPDGFTEFPDKRRIYDSPRAYRDNGEIIGYLTDDRYDASLYYIAYKQLYRDPTVMPATDLPERLMYRNPYGSKSRYKKVPFENYTLVSHKGQIAIFFNKNNVAKSRIQKFLEQALVVSSASRKAKGMLPQDIEKREKGNLEQLQSMLNKKDFSSPRSIIQHRSYGTSWIEPIYPRR